jgi:hypothetical protein
MKSTFTFLGGAAAAATSRARTEGFLIRLGARSSLFSSISKSGSDNALFREGAAAGGRVKEGGGEGERERTDRGEEDMVVLVVIVRDVGSRTYENEEGREVKRRSFSKQKRSRYIDLPNIKYYN